MSYTSYFTLLNGFIFMAWLRILGVNFTLYSISNSLTANDLNNSWWILIFFFFFFRIFVYHRWKIKLIKLLVTTCRFMVRYNQTSFFFVLFSSRRYRVFVICVPFRSVCASFLRMKNFVPYYHHSIKRCSREYITNTYNVYQWCCWRAEVISHEYSAYSYSFTHHTHTHAQTNFFVNEK